MKPPMAILIPRACRKRRPPRVRALAGVLCGALAWTASAGAAIRPPRLQYQVTTLANGLTVVLSEDHSTPIVHLQLWYHVGSKDERPGRTGPGSRTSSST